jgi:hypothetical protein
MKISYVPVGQISGLIPALLPYLTKSEQWSDGRVSVDDLLRLMLNDLLQLWVVHEETTIHGFFGVEVKQYPQAKMLTVQYCAMETGTLDAVDSQMMDIAEDVAKKSGCAGVEFIGRPGWKKIVQDHGYNVQSVMYQKFFKEYL